MNHTETVLAMRNPLVIYHDNCMDGFGAAWSVRFMFDDDAEYIPASYGQDAPDVAGRDVIIADFSYPRAKLLEMHTSARSLVVLDHHKTAAADLEGLDFALFDMNRSGAGITWDVVCGSLRAPLIDYIEDRDLWHFALPRSRDINAWIGCVDFTFADYDLLALEIGESFATVADRGFAVQVKIERYVREMARQASRVSFAGHDGVPVVNAPYINTSELVGHLAESAPFAVGWFRDSEGTFRYSLRSRGDVDVSAIAKQFGGGGHKNAAGFSSRELLV